jgi:hypothetical protein
MPHDSEQRMVPLRLRTLAEITRIPRETVRRKLHAVKARRYVARYAGFNAWLAGLAIVLLGVIVESVVIMLGGCGGSGESSRASLLRVRRSQDTPARQPPPSAR